MEKEVICGGRKVAGGMGMLVQVGGGVVGGWGEGSAEVVRTSGECIPCGIEAVGGLERGRAGGGAAEGLMERDLLSAPFWWGGSPRTRET